MSEAKDITLGELGRRVDRVEVEMRAGFDSMRQQIERLAFVPAGVYAADKSAEGQRIQRIEDALEREVEARVEAQKTADQRAWQSRWSLVMALIGMPLTVVGSIVIALIVPRIT